MWPISSELTNKKLRRGAYRSVRALNADIRAWIENWNENPRPYRAFRTSGRLFLSPSFGFGGGFEGERLKL